MLAVYEGYINSANAWLPFRILTRNVQSPTKSEKLPKQPAFEQGSVNITQGDHGRNTALQ